MTSVVSTEFYITPKGGIMINDDKGTRPLSEQSRDFVSAMIGRINDFHPEALADASEVYSSSRYNIPYFEFKIVRRFIKCNWAKYDSTIDIDQFGNFNFEDVECPLRGECQHEGVICKPKFNSNLSDREREVMQLLYEGCQDDVVAGKLYISAETVKTHKRNAFRRTGVHSLPEFIIYARDKGLFR